MTARDGRASGRSTRMIDSKQLSALFDAHAAGLVLYARQIVADRAAAEDVVHDVFVRLIGLPTAPDDPKAWLFRAVRNAAISQTRSTSRRRRRESGVSGARHEWFEHRVEDLIDAASAQRALESLPPQLREVVVLRIWAQLGFQQIADLLGLSVSSAFERYQTALSMMRRKLETPRCPTNSNPT
jgi:RNA polymerase sigma-70 factor (ECF subfamily)